MSDCKSVDRIFEFRPWPDLFGSRNHQRRAGQQSAKYFPDCPVETWRCELEDLAPGGDVKMLELSGA